MAVMSSTRGLRSLELPCKAVLSWSYRTPQTPQEPTPGSTAMVTYLVSTISTLLTSMDLMELTMAQLNMVYIIIMISVGGEEMGDHQY